MDDLYLTVTVARDHQGRGLAMLAASLYLVVTSIIPKSFAYPEERYGAAINASVTPISKSVATDSPIKDFIKFVQFDPDDLKSHEDAFMQGIED